MADYLNSPSVNPYWYYDPHGYQPNVSIPFNGHMAVSTPSNPAYDTYTNHSNSFVDSGYLSRTPTPPTPIQQHSPQAMLMRKEIDTRGESDSLPSDKSVSDSKPRLPYVKRTRIQYTMQQLQILEEAFQNNHYPEVTTVDALAELLDVRHEKISIWFQNRRSRFKRQQKPKASAPTVSLPVTKKMNQPVAPVPVVPPPVYEANTPYYPGYFWPSPIAENRNAMSYGSAHHNSSFYDNGYGNMSSSMMWNPNSTSYSNVSWQPSPNSTLNLSSAPSPLALTPTQSDHHASI